MPIVGPDIARFILAGDTIGGATLSRFFAFHVFFIPAIVFAFVGLHLVLVLRHGISERPKKGDTVDPATYRAQYSAMLQREGVPFWPDAAWRDVVFGSAVVATIVLLAVIVGPPPLDKPPDPSILQAYPRPDWYFLWYFAVLALAPHSLENFIIVAGPLVFGAVLLLLPLANTGARSVRDRPLAAVLVVFIWTVILAFWVAGRRADWSPNFEVAGLPASVVGSTDPTVIEGARLFHDKGCEYCHAIDGYGGKRGPDLSDVRSRMPPDQIGARITNGSLNMPAFARTLTPEQVNTLVSFLSTRGRSSTRQ
jgi:ubiquinol-cytochrome c reductase cytochrome b subunit